MRYILSELDEQEREESFRLKRFKQLKYKNVRKVKKGEDEDEPKQPEPEPEPEPEHKPKPEPKPQPKDEPKPEPTPPPIPQPKVEPKPAPTPPPKPKPKVEPEPELKPVPKPAPKPEPMTEPTPEPIAVPELPKLDSLELLMNHIIEVVRLAEKLETKPIPPEKEKGLTVCDLGNLKNQMKKLIELSEGPIKDRVCSYCGNIGRTVSSCSCLLEAPKQVQTGDFSIPKPEGYDAAMNLMPKSKVKTKIPGYILEPRRLEPRDRIADSKPIDLEAMSKNRIQELENHVDQVICMTNNYQGEGLLSKSAEDFLKCCQSVKTKIQRFQSQKIVKAKLDRLKEKVTNLEKITTIVQKTDLSATTVSSFMSCCKEFKAKIDRLKSCRGAPSVGSIEKLLNKIDYSIVLSKEAKDKGLVSESVEEFIKSCVEIKTKIEPHNEPKPQVIDDLLFNLNDIISFIAKYKDGAAISNSIETFYQNCKTTKAKLDSYKAGPLAGCGKSTCPRTPPKTPPPGCPCKTTSSHAPSVNSCGVSVPSEQGTTTTRGGDSAVNQQSQNSYKSDSTQDSNKAGPPAECCKSTSPKTPPKTLPCPCEKTSSHAPSVNYCTAGASFPSEQSTKTCSCQSAVSQQLQHSWKSKSTQDSDKAGPLAVCDISTCPKTPPKTPPCPCKQTSSRVPSVNSCCAGASVSSKQGPTTTYGGQSAVSQQSQHSCKSKSTQDFESSPPCTASTCFHKQPSTHSCHSGSLQLAPPKKSKSAESRNICSARSKSPTTGPVKVIVIPKEKKKKKDPKKGQKTMSTMTTVRIYKEIDGSIVEETETFTVKQRLHDGKKPPSRTSSCGSCASTRRQRNNDSQKPSSKSSSCGSCASGKSAKRINLCKVPVTKGFIQSVRNIKSETLIRSVDLSSPYLPFLWSSVSADTLSSLERSHANETVEQDPFFCASPTTSDDDSDLPM